MLKPALRELQPWGDLKNIFQIFLVPSTEGASSSLWASPSLRAMSSLSRMSEKEGLKITETAISKF